MYTCWNCSLTYGSEEDWEPSRLCPACKQAISNKSGWQGLPDWED